MTDKRYKSGKGHVRRFGDAVGAKSERRLVAEANRRRSVWFGLGMFGMVGWSIAIPTVMGIALGIWIDSTWPSPYSWTLTLLFLGIGVGCFTAWGWVNRERRDD